MPAIRLVEEYVNKGAGRSAGARSCEPAADAAAPFADELALSFPFGQSMPTSGEAFASSSPFSRSTGSLGDIAGAASEHPFHGMQHNRKEPDDVHRLGSSSGATAPCLPSAAMEVSGSLPLGPGYMAANVGRGGASNRSVVLAKAVQPGHNCIGNPSAAAKKAARPPTTDLLGHHPRAQSQIMADMNPRSDSRGSCFGGFAELGLPHISDESRPPPAATRRAVRPPSRPHSRPR